MCVQFRYIYLKCCILKFSTKLKVKISFSSLNFCKSLFFVPKHSKVCFLFLNFTKHSTFSSFCLCPLVYVLCGVTKYWRGNWLGINHFIFKKNVDMWLTMIRACGLNILVRQIYPSHQPQSWVNPNRKSPNWKPHCPNMKTEYPTPNPSRAIASTTNSFHKKYCRTHIA